MTNQGLWSNLVRLDMSNESNYCALEIELDMAHAEEQYRPRPRPINKRSLRWSTHGHRSRQGTTEEHVEENLMGKFHMIQTEIKKAQDHVGFVGGLGSSEK